MLDDPSTLPEQTPEWLDAMAAAGGYEDASRLYEFRDGRRFVLPLARRRGPPGGWYGSFPPAWGIGGLVGKDPDAGVIREVLRDLRDLGAARVTIRPDPLTAPLWAEAVRGADVVAVPRRAHVLDLTGGRDDVAARLSGSTRRALRTAERRGVTVESDLHGRLLPVYHRLFVRSVDRWAAQQGEPRLLAHWRARRRDPLRKLYAMSDRLAGRMSVSVAYVEGVPAAGTIVLFGRTAHYTRGAMDRDLAGPARASHAAQWRNILAACDAGCTTYHLGESGDSASLAAFKERFGAEPVSYQEYRIERAPFTAIDNAVRTAVKRAVRFRDA